MRTEIFCNDCKRVLAIKRSEVDVLGNLLIFVDTCGVNFDCENRKNRREAEKKLREIKEIIKP